MPDSTAEHQRLAIDGTRRANWKRWGTYLSERQWGTVREDYSSNGDAWSAVSHDDARSYAYRWGEDGLLGWTDRQCRLCFGLALWNGKDPILKERLFGLTGHEGNHGEDVKELYYYVDSTPTYSYVRGLYKYPQDEFPYARLVAENARRGKGEPELELHQLGLFELGRYFDVGVEYAKASADDTLIRVRITNRSAEAATIHVLPQLWFRNTWVWGCEHEGCTLKPLMKPVGPGRVLAEHETLGQYVWDWVGGDPPELLLTENLTNQQRLYKTKNAGPFVKDAFHRRVVKGDKDAVSDRGHGTKAAWWSKLELPAGGAAVLRMRLSPEPMHTPEAAADLESFEEAFAVRSREADDFYGAVLADEMDEPRKRVSRQSLAGVLWSKQFYHYVVEDWLEGDPNTPAPPAERKAGRNRDWRHFFARDVLSMPDKWEYPWFAAWDTAFHTLPLAMVDPDDARRHLGLFLREWYMHPNGQLPAYEFAFGDVNPPVHAWAVWRVYKMCGPKAKRDKAWLASCFQKLLLNFNWWVNRKDPEGDHVFSGGFLGLDNIGVFDRSHPPAGLENMAQSDGTAWMAFFCGTMLSIALELADHGPGYEDMASKFFEHFVAIAKAMNDDADHRLWHDEDGFYYDHLHFAGEEGRRAVRLRSLVGLMPLIAVEVFEESRLARLPGFTKRMNWFLRHNATAAGRVRFSGDGYSVTGVDTQVERDGDRRVMLALPGPTRLKQVLRYVFDTEEFLSPHGVRSMSKRYGDKPFRMKIHGATQEVRYTPAESDTHMFGGNSNWRGPVWFPLNYLLIEALQRYDHFYGPEFTVEIPTGSGKPVRLRDAALELERRLTSLFTPGADGRAPALVRNQPQGRPDFDGLLQFHEYFDGDTGRGCGAAHQTGWTALVARCAQDLARAEQGRGG
ncbi:MAG: glucosidase [Planctomycetota bacterium]